jgi:spermidine synthase
MAARLRAPSTVEVAVLVSGTTSMGLEILAGRIVAPTFGSSIYTWGSIIGVFLTALSLGYYVGGRRAAHAEVSDLLRILLSAATFVAFLIVFGDGVVRATASLPLPPQYGALVPIAVLFGPPTYLLGFVSPYAAEFSDTERTGEASGNVYALGTMGSIVGAFATTFWLIPHLSVTAIALLFGVLQLAAAVRVAAPTYSRRAVASVGVVALLLAAAVAGSTAGASLKGDVVYQTQTPYQKLAVVDDGGTRTLYLGGYRHSAMDKNAPNDHVYTYTRYFHLPYLLNDSSEPIEDVLFVGGGGFTGPKAFQSRYDVDVDVVEIDPEVVRVAKRYFRLEPGANTSVHVADGRQFLRETDETYDLIVLDAYQRDKVPFQLTTREFFELAHSRLDDAGVLLANTIGAPTGPASQFVRAEYKTLDQVFSQVYAVRTSNRSAVQNVELVATKADEPVSKATLRERADNRAVGVRLDDAVRFLRYDLPTDGVPVLTDDRAPVDRLLDPLVGRRYVVEREDGNATVTDAALEPPGDRAVAAHQASVALPATTAPAGVDLRAGTATFSRGTP